mmetsp:Transcript_52211/g.146517  ORF Transcript_52211/g.146517 Transcript_52211/m.146517 type:complete len:269 (+) Transcript_52211:484-1290(+)
MPRVDEEQKGWFSRLRLTVFAGHLLPLCTWREGAVVPPVVLQDGGVPRHAVQGLPTGAAMRLLSQEQGEAEGRSGPDKLQRPFEGPSSGLGGRILGPAVPRCCRGWPGGRSHCRRPRGHGQLHGRRNRQDARGGRGIFRRLGRGALGVGGQGFGQRSVALVWAGALLAGSPAGAGRFGPGGFQSQVVCCLAAGHIPSGQARGRGERRSAEPSADGRKRRARRRFLPPRPVQRHCRRRGQCAGRGPRRQRVVVERRAVEDQASDTSPAR